MSTRKPTTQRALDDSGDGCDFGLKAIQDDSALQSAIDRQQSFLFRERRSKARTTKQFIPTIDDSLLKMRRSAHQWHQFWSFITTAFCSEVDTLVTEGDFLPRAVYPAGKTPSRSTATRLSQWKRMAADSFKKSECWIKEKGRRDQWSFDPETYYMLHQEIGAWALLAAIREAVFRHPTLQEDELLTARCRPHTCRLLAARFYAFAQARRHFHERLRSDVAKMRGLNDIDERRSALLWRTLIWPVAVRNRWTYGDVLIAERLFFIERPDSPEMKGVGHRPASLRASARSFEGTLLETDRDWYWECLTVSRPHRDAHKDACKRYGLLLAERSLSAPRKRTPQEPRNLMCIPQLPKFGLPDLWLPKGALP